jgi:uncharacterized protein
MDTGGNQFDNKDNCVIVYSYRHPIVQEGGFEMEKTKLTAMTVVELKALAKKRKVSLSASAKKADIIGALLTAARKSKPAAKKTAAKKTIAKKTAGTKAAAAVKPAPKKAGKTTKKVALAQKPGAVRKVPSKTVPEPVLPVHDWKLPPGAEEPLLAQERISEAKYYTGPAMQAAVAAFGELPRTYGDDRIVLMTRDPFVVHAFWEASQARLERERAWFGWSSKLCVRIYDITGVQFDGRNALGYYDQEVSEQAGSWYFDLGRPSHSFCADLGLLSPEGRFMTLVRSNYVTMPRDGVSDVIDEEWMLVDEEFWKLYGYPEGFKGGVSSPELQEMMRRRRMQEITSPGLFSRERVKAKARRK